MGLRTFGIGVVLAAVVGAGVLGVGSDGSDDLDQAKRAFERHNYRAALEAVDRCLASEPAAELGDEARRVRGLCLLKLRRWEEGVSELKALLDANDEFAHRPALHEALGEVGLQRHKLRHLAIEHYGMAAELHLGEGDKQAAAAALLKQAEGFVGFDGWDSLPDPKVPPPEDWQASRRLQRKYALAALDRAIELAGDSELAAEAVFRKARLHWREFRFQPADVEVALKLFAEVADRWPAFRRAAEALYQVAQITESFKEDYVAAVKYYRRVVEGYGGSSWAKRAARRIERTVSPTLQLAVQGAVLPGAEGRIHFNCRNVKEVTLRAYRVDLFALIRRIDQLHRLKDWQPDGEPVATWKLTLPDRGQHRFFASGSDDQEPTVVPVKEAGAYVIIGQAASGRVRAQTMMVISPLACVVKSARSVSLVLVADAVTGQPAAAAEVLVQRRLGKNRFHYITGRTDDAGRYRLVNTERDQNEPGADLMMLVRHGQHYAVCNSSFYWYWWGYHDRYRGYCFTDRPVYRPDQVIHFKTIVRGYRQGEYETLAGQRLEMKLHDPGGEVVDQRELVTGQAGSVSGEINLPDGAALGLYHIQLTAEGQRVDAGGGTRFRVEEYRKPEFEVTVGADRPDYRVGDSIEVRISARYYFGEPVAGAKVKCTVHRARHYPYFGHPTPWPWFFEDVHSRVGEPSRGRRMLYPGPRPRDRDLVGRFEATTDERGIASVRLQTRPFDADPEVDLRYDVEAEVTDASRRVITGSGRIKVTRRPFYIQVRPRGYVYQPGDTVRLEIEAKSPNDAPVAFQGRCEVHRLTRNVEPDSGAESYRLGDKVFERAVSVDQTGRGQLQWVTDEEGPFRVVVSTEPRDGVTVAGSCDLWICRRGGRYGHYAYREVELVPDRAWYAVGQTAKVLINTRFDSCYVLVTAEGDDLFDDRIVFVKGGTHLLELPIRRAHVPNFELSAVVLRDNKVYQDQVSMIVPPADRFLSVKIEAPAEVFHPRERVELGVRTTDSTGGPAPAEVALMMVDASIYYVQPEFRPQIEKHFYGRKRPHLVRTSSSYDVYSGRVGGVRGVMHDAMEAGVAGDAPMAMKAKAPSAGVRRAEESAAQFATAEIRKHFPDTALWVAQVNTDGEGKASVKVEMPDTLTTWRVQAIAIDGDTRVGQAATDLVTRKDVIVRLEAPRFLVEGDQPVLTVIAHNYLDTAKTVLVTLAASEQLEIGRAAVGGVPMEASSPGRVEVAVPAGGEVAVDFTANALAVGQTTLTATAAADVDADAVQITLPIVVYGADRLAAVSGSIRQSDDVHDKAVTLSVPEKVAPGTASMEIHLNPSIAAVMIDALPFLLEYPYGCTEQTMSRFLPAVVVRRTLQQLGIDLEAIGRKIEARGGRADTRLPERFRRNPVFNDAMMNDMIRTGLERLAELQRPDGGWGWWAAGEPNPYMTAYVVYGLTEAVAADLAVDRGMLDRGVAFLLKRVVSPEPAGRYRWAADDDNVRTWMLYALARHDPNLLDRADVHNVLRRIYDDRDGLTDYGRAMLMIALHRIGDERRAGILVENLYNTVRLDDELGTANWGDGGSYRYWYNNGLEATAMVLRALLMVQPDHDYVRRAVNWLVRNRRGSRWYSTKDTAFVVYALADYLVASGELQADMTIKVTIDDRIKRSLKVTPANALTFDARIVVGPADLPPGEHRVELSRSGKGNLYYAVYLDYFTRQDPIEPAGHEVFITRKYARLVPKQVTKTRQVYDFEKRKNVPETYQAIEYDRVAIDEGQAIASGELIEVQLDIEAKSNFEYLIFEDPKPAGCEPVRLHSGHHYGRGPYVNVELRDKKTAFFATYLPQGKHPLAYRLRCETPGRFHALPARVEAMYSPYVRANSRSDKVNISGSGP